MVNVLASTILIYIDFRLAIIFSVASVRYKMLSQMFLGPEVQFTPSSPAPFPGCLLPQSRT
jgi:hypothetical protein